MKLLNIIFLSVLISLSLHATTEDKPKRTLQANYMLNYNQLPQEVDNFSDIFTEGMIYGRLRAHWFFYDWDHEKDGLRQDHNILGLGGSLNYKTAPYKGFSASAGLYFTSAGTSIDDQPSNVGLLKSGKDVISRYNLRTGKGKSFAVLAESYLQYERDNIKMRLGREIFNSFFTKSNDSKMIPNTFEGVTLEIKNIEKTRIRAAYLTQQKLRDHDNFHSLIMYDNSDTSLKSQWDGNDDSAGHKGLNYTNFLKDGIDEDPYMLVLDGYSRALFTKDLKISASALYLEDLFYTAMAEINYKFNLGNGYILTPGFRYVQQFDDGAGDIGGAALTGLAAKNSHGGSEQGRYAYSDPDSVDTYLTAARLVLKKDAVSFSLGYTKVADKADFITPWRGFVTGGYTRAMARYNWIANTETFRARLTYDFSKAKQVKGLRTFASFTRENYDTDKIVANLVNIYYFGLIQNINDDLSFRFRSEWVDERVDTLTDHGEVRLELNYLF